MTKDQAKLLSSYDRSLSRVVDQYAGLTLEERVSITDAVDGLAEINETLGALAALGLAAAVTAYNERRASSGDEERADD